MRIVLVKPLILLFGIFFYTSIIKAQGPGNCLDFNGSNNYVKMNDWKLGSSDFTIEVWVKPTSLTGNIIISNRKDADGNGAAGNWYSFEFYNNFLTLEMGNDGQGNYQWIPTSYNPSLNVWTHFALTRAGNILTIYANGSLVYNASFPTINNLNSVYNTAMIGARLYNGTITAPFQGQIDELKIWKLARSKANIQSDMYAEAVGNETGLFAYYNFDQGTAAGNNPNTIALNDVTGNGDYGSLINFTLAGTTSNWENSDAFVPLALNANNITSGGFTANWYAVGGANSYIIDVSNKSDFSNLLVNSQNVGNVLSYAVSGLTSNASNTYYYRVRYVNGNYTSPNSVPIVITGTAGNALAFDGSNDYVQLPTSTLLNFAGSGSLTVGAWVYPTAGNAAIFAKKQDGTAGRLQISFSVNSSKLFLGFDQYNANGWQTFTSVTNVPNNQWSYVAFTMNAGTVTFYINGKADNTGTLDANHLNAPASTGVTTVGGNGILMGYASEMLDEVGIWNSALSGTAINNLMYTSPTGSEPGLIAAYNFNSSSNSTLTDVSSNALNGALNNFMLSGTSSNWVASGAFCPIALPASNVSLSGFTANWQAVPNATSYVLDVASSSDFTSIISTGIAAGSGTSYKVTGLFLSSGTSYYYRVRSVNGIGASSNSNVQPFMVGVGNCLNFDGIDDNVSCGAQNPTTLTMEAWFNPTVTNRDLAIVSTLNESSPAGCELHLNTIGQLVFTIKSSAWLDIKSNSIVLPNTWNHAAVTYDGVTVKLYLNGILVGTGAVSSYAAGTGNLRIGQRSVNVTASIFMGTIDEVSIWNTTLSQSALQSNMFTGLVGTETGLMSYYKFDQASGTTLNDVKGAYNGTLSNFTLSGTTSNWVSSGAECPIIFNATNVTTTGFTANWQTVPNATGYFIDVSSSSTFSSFVSSNISAGTSTSFNVTGLSLTAGTNYYYRVRYTNASGTSTNSIPQSFMVGFGNALNFNGTSSYVNCGTVSTTSNFSNGFTYMGWVNWTSFNSYSRLLDFGTGQASNNIVIANYTTTGQLIFSNYNGATANQFITTAVVLMNQWVHVAATINSSGVGTIYINGQVAGSANIGIPVNIARTNCYLGRSNWSTDTYFNGSMDNFRVYERALSQAEIQAGMGNDVVGNENGLILAYNFNQGTAAGTNTSITTVNDATGKNTGTLTNFALTGSTSNFIASQNTAHVYYVDASAASSGTGSLASPFKSIQSLNGIVLNNNDTVKVAAGSYSLTANLSFSSDVIILGGYKSDGTFATRNPVSYPSIIQPASGYTGYLIYESCCSPLIDGFTIQNAYNSSENYGSNILGGAILIATQCGSSEGYLKTPRINNCYFYNNKAITGSYGAYGGAIAIIADNTNTQPFITNCTFVGNFATQDASAIEILNSKTTISNCTFYNNAVSAGTGTIMSSSGAIVNLFHNTLVGNTSVNYTGGLSNGGSSTTNMFGNIIAGNTGGTAPGSNEFNVWNQSGTINDLGYNLFGYSNGYTGACCFTMVSTSQWVTNTALANILEASGTVPANGLFPAKVNSNGGYTPTIKLIGRVLSNTGGTSFTVREVPNTYNITTDQRGVARTFGTASIGAYEFTETNQGVIYVNGTLSAAGDGLTPATAYNNLQTAINASLNDTIKVAAGTYNQPGAGFAFTSYAGENLIIYGSYKSDFTTRDTALYRTTAQGYNGGSGVAPIFWIINSNLTLDGVTVANGNGSGNANGSETYEGGAIHFHATTSVYNLNLNNCLFKNNKNVSTGNGGALYLLGTSTYYGTANITGCTFIGNSTASTGGAIANAYFNTNITNCIFNGNTASGDAGALFLNSNTTIVNSCTFINNKALDAGGILVQGGTSVVKNCTFFNNQATNSGGAIHNLGTLTLINNTISGNSSANTSTGYSGGLGCSASTTTIIEGNIIAGNQSQGGLYPADIQLLSSSCTFTDNGYNIIGNGGSTIYGVGALSLPNSTSLVVSQLYRILESTNQSNTTAYLFPAKVANNGGATPTIKIIGRSVTNTSDGYVNINSIPIPGFQFGVTPVYDQRGVTRKMGSATIGAYEYTESSTNGGSSIYVSISGTTLGTGTISNPYNDLTSALVAALPGDTIKVAAGTYNTPSGGGSFNITTENITLLGGYNSNFTSCDPRLYATTLNQLGAVNGPVFWTSPSYAITLFTMNGFTVTGGKACNTGNGGGMDFESNSLLKLNISNCTFSGNSATYGGGIYVNSNMATSQVTISNCTFTGNTATTDAGALDLRGCTYLVQNCTFYNNTAANNSGAIWSGLSAHTTLINNTIVGNYNSSASNGGAIDCASGILSLQGNIIAGNNSKNTTGYDLWKEIGTITDNGYNIFGIDATSWFTLSSKSQRVATAQLYRILECSNPTAPTDSLSSTYRLFVGNLADNYGPTKTIRLIGKKFNAGSGDINVNVVPSVVGSSLIPVTDQRGFSRVSGAACYGAYDFNAWNDVVYVNAGAASGGTGFTASSPVNDLNYAISVLANPNDTIKVAGATYTTPATTSSFNIVRNLTLLGGYNSTFTTRDAKGNLTTLQGNASSVVAVIYAPNINLTIDGFTVTGGNVTGSNPAGGGISYNISGTKGYSLNVSNCLFTGNTASTSGGAGIGLYSSSTTSSTINISKCTFTNNNTIGNGSAINSTYGSSNFIVNATNNTFYKNSGTGSGSNGTIEIQGGTLNFYNNTVVGNTVVNNCAGLVNYGSPAATTNMAGNIIAGNSGGSGMHDVWVQSGTLNDYGYNIFGDASTSGFTLNGTSKSVSVSTGNQLYRILDNTKTGVAYQTINTRLFAANLVNNGGETPTVKLIGKYLKNTTGTGSDSITVVREVPTTVNGGSVTMPTIDQCGVLRSINGACVGAYELSGASRYTYVYASAANGGTGSITAPYNSLAPALISAIGGDTILVAQGNYTPGLNTSYTINKNVTILGGYNSTYTQRGSSYPTIISATTTSTTPVFVVNSSASFDRLSITKASCNASAGGGMYINLTTASTISISNCNFSNNSATYGGAISTYSSVTTPSILNILNCTFTNNTTNADDGGALLLNSYFTTTVSNCTFYGNTAARSAGAIYNAGTLHLGQNTIVGNSGNLSYAGGIDNVGTCDIEGNIIAGNSGTANEHDVYNEGSSATDNGYNIFETGGTNLTLNANSNYIAANQLYLLLDNSSSTTSQRLFTNANIANNGGYTNIIKVKVFQILNTSSSTITINSVPLTIAGITMATIDERGVNRANPSCIGAYEFRNISQAFNFTTSTIGSNSVGLSWTPGSFSKRIVFMNLGSTGTPTLSAINYTANNIFMKGSNNGSGWYCVYSGAGSSVNVLSLSPNKTYRVKVCEFDSTNYYTIDTTGNPVNFTTSKLPQIISLPVSLSKNFGDADFNPQNISSLGLKPIKYVSSNTNVATIVNDTIIHIVAAGNTTISANQSGNDTVSAASQVNVTLTVKKAPLSITAYGSGIYGSTPIYKFSTAGLKFNDSIIGVTYSGGTATAFSNVGNYNITPSAAVFYEVASSNNYAISYIQGIYVVNQATLVINADNKTKSFGDANPVFTYLKTGLQNNDALDTVYIHCAAKNASKVGAYDITIDSIHFKSGTLTSNYNTPILNKGILTVNKSIVNVIANAKTKVYAANNPAFTDTITGLKLGNTIDSVILTTIANDTSDIGNYTITASHAIFINGCDSNYTVNYIQGILTITSAPLTLKANDLSKTYGSANPTFTYSASGMASWDSLKNVSLNSTANIVSGVNTYPISISNAIFSYGNISNYSITYNAGTLTVNFTTLTIAASDTSKIYGDANPAYSFKVSGLQNNDNVSIVSYTTLANSGSNVGNYEIIPKDAIFSLGSSANYSITYKKGNLVIKPASLIVTAENKSKIYGSAIPVFTFSKVGLKGSDNITNVNFTSLVNTISDTGTYIIKPSDAAFGSGNTDNYSITYVNGNIVVKPSILTITANNVTRDYFTSKNSILTYNYNGFVNGEDESVLIAKPEIHCNIGKVALPGVYTDSIIISGASANNYTINYQQGTLTISDSRIQICLVTVDVKSGHDEVVWERTTGMAIKKYNIYREDNSTSFNLIGSRSFNVNGLFIDSTSNPRKQQYMYKITAVDSSNNESIKSNYHEPAFLQWSSNQGGVNLTWQPYKIENGITEFVKYRLYKSTDSTNLVQFDSISPDFNAFTDEDSRALKIRMFYRIGGVLSNSCSSASLLKSGDGLLVESVSNMEDNRLRSYDTTSNVNTNNSSEINLSVYPNPYNNKASVTYYLEKENQIIINLYDTYGNLVRTLINEKQNTGMHSTTIDPNSLNLKLGIYIMEMKYGNNIIQKKLVYTR